VEKNKLTCTHLELVVLQTNDPQIAQLLAVLVKGLKNHLQKQTPHHKGDLQYRLRAYCSDKGNIQGHKSDEFDRTKILYVRATVS
jgi:hypothetical protein